MIFRRAVLAAAAACLVPLGAARASDHADTAENVNRIGADMTDVYAFPNPHNAANVVLVMNTHGLIPAGQGATFDPGVLYQLKIDNTGDYVEDLVIQFRFTGVGANQKVLMAGPMKPFMTGTTSIFGRPNRNKGTINQTFSPLTGVSVFAGVRSEPFFLDLNQFYTIFPDRMTPLTGRQVDFTSIIAADTPQAGGWRPPGLAMDYLANLNVMSIVVEMPKTMLGTGVVHLWETTSIPTGAPNFVYTQQDRLARPLVNEVLATVTLRRHEINNKDNPTDDAGQVKNDIAAFMNFPAARSAAISGVLQAVLVPDVMTFDLSQNTTKASYLGFETGGATGSKFGGRALADDVVDISLGAIFGNTIPALGLAADDGKELPTFTTDNVGPHTDYQDVFPYLGVPH